MSNPMPVAVPGRVGARVLQARLARLTRKTRPTRTGPWPSPRRPTGSRAAGAGRGAGGVEQRQIERRARHDQSFGAALPPQHPSSSEGTGGPHGCPGAAGGLDGSRSDPGHRVVAERWCRGQQLLAGQPVRVQSYYRLGAGNLDLNLAVVKFPPAGKTVDVTVGLGNLTVEVPKGTVVSVDAKTGIGQVDVFGQELPTSRPLTTAVPAPPAGLRTSTWTRTLVWATSRSRRAEPGDLVGRRLVCHFALKLMANHFGATHS